jgi:hypothetical protein
MDDGQPQAARRAVDLDTDGASRSSVTLHESLVLGLRDLHGSAQALHQQGQCEGRNVVPKILIHVRERIALHA